MMRTHGNFLNLFTVVISVLIITESHAGWIKTYGEFGDDCGYHVLETGDECYLVTGTTKSNSKGKEDLWLLKVDSAGDMLWSKTYGESDTDVGLIATQTDDGGYAVLGKTQSSEYNPGGVWLLRTDPHGDTLWTQTYGGEITKGCIAQTLDRGFDLIGDMGFIKTDSAGNVLKTKTYEEYYSKFYCSNSDQDNGYILTGLGTIVKIDNDGEVVWKDTDFPYTVHMVNNIAYIQESYWGTYLAAGWAWGPGSDTLPNYDLWIADIEIGGGLSWDYIYGREPTDVESGYCIKPLSSIGYIVGAYPWTLMKGIGGWRREYEGQHQYFDITADGGFIVVGSIEDGDSNDLLLIKTDSLGLIEAISETPVLRQNEMTATISVGRQVVLSYANCPTGFHAEVFDASGRMVDTIETSSQSGTITWGSGFTPGVYFIREITDKSTSAQKVVLVR